MSSFGSQTREPRDPEASPRYLKSSEQAAETLGIRDDPGAIGV